MRRYLKTKTVAVALLIIWGLYFVGRSDFLGQGKPQGPVPLELKWQTERLISTESWVEEGSYLPLNASYQLLAGAPFAQQRFLAVGISSVKRTKGSYLILTLQSLFSQSSPEERSSMVVILLLADFDVIWRIYIAKEIKVAFPAELEQGQLVVIHVPEEYYPTLTGLKRNFNDPPERVTFRSKQNIDYSFLMHYSAGLGQYYLQLEDDVSSAKNFLSTIKLRINEQNAKKKPWVVLEFSALGYIGKLYKSAHLPLLARFLFLFYQEMPCDWLMNHFRETMVQRDTILFKPSLFQHMGTFSSFEGRYNNLKDKDFEEGLYSNPPAQVYSSMSTYEKNYPQLAWEAGGGFFWGHSPEKGDYLTVVFKDPTVVTQISIETGSGGKDLLQEALVELGLDVIDDGKEKTCKKFQMLGKLEKGRLEWQETDKKHYPASSCLRILVTAGQRDWVIIKKIRVTKNEYTSTGGVTDQRLSKLHTD